MTATTATNGSLKAMAPSAYGESLVVGAAPRIGAEPHPAEDAMSRGFDGADAERVEGVESELAFADGSRGATRSIRWTCSTNKGNRLFVQGVPFTARYLAWSVTNISWQAGLGWPVFTTYCPASDYDYRFKFPSAFRFQIVPVFGGHYWTGSGPSASGTGNEITEVWFWVNDFPDAYSDNAGTFELTVTGWA